MHEHGTSGFPSAPTGFQSGPPTWQPAPPKGQSRGLTYVALAIAVIATVLAIVGWFRPTPPPPPSHPSAPTYTEQQIADAKARACGALNLVNKAAIQNSGTGAPPQQSADPAMAEAQAAGSRLSLVAGAWYLRDHLDPATPEPIAAAFRHISQIMLDLAENYLVGIQNADPAQADLIKQGNAAFPQALELCK